MLLRLTSVLALTALVIAVLPAAPAPGASLPPTEHLVLDGLPTTEGADGALSQRIITPIPFSMVGLSIPDGAHVALRTSADARVWSQWVEVDALGEEDEGPDPAGGEATGARPDWERMSEPVWVGEASWLQVRVDGGSPKDVAVHLIDSLGLGRSLGERARDALRAAWSASPARSANAGTRPSIVSRRQWGADESKRRAAPSYSPRTRAGVLHHTAASNRYSPQQAPGIVRGIYHYHTQSLGWSDIGYNLLVDRYGTVYEGRAGGVERGVIGAHAGGFNTETFGVAILGTFMSAPPPRPAWDAAAQTFAWKFRVHDIDADPNATVVMTSRGSSRYPRGHRARLHTLSGHRDVSRTACPGDALYARLPALRHDVHARSRSVLPNLGIPLVGDWTGDGIDTPGWYRDGWALLRLTNSTGGTDIRFRYGRPGDRPVVGDWDGDGRDSLGVVRGNVWHLRNSLDTGGAHVRFTYGFPGDIPVAGDWNGDGRDGPGAVRGNVWHVRAFPAKGPSASFPFGRAGDRPVVGDWNATGRDTVGVVRGDVWHLRHTLSAGPANQRFRYGEFRDRAISGSWLPAGGDTAGVVRGDAWHLRHRLLGDVASQTFVYRG